MLLSGFVNLGKSEKQRKLWPIFLKNPRVEKQKKRKEKKKKKIYHFVSALFSKDMLRIEKGVRSMDFI